MKRSELAMLLALAALWGSSYLFMRLGAGEFGTVPFAGLRAALAAGLLLPFAAWRSGLGTLRTRWREVALVGLTQSALPFVLFSFASQHIDTGLSAILGATTPLFTACISRWWLGERLGASRLAGLGIGFAGVALLAWDRAGLKSGGIGAGLAIGACLLAAMLYGFSSNYTRQRTAGVPPLVVAAGSQLASALLLAAPVAWSWPETLPGPRAWAALGALAVACTAVAYALFYQLIARVGAARTVSVTFLIPAFGVLWGAVFLGETITPGLLLGCTIVLAGTALTTGVLRLPPAWTVGRRASES
jgi:drug/metabolite transporter (DMT)-like permease